MYYVTKKLKLINVLKFGNNYAVYSYHLCKL